MSNLPPLPKNPAVFDPGRFGVAFSPAQMLAYAEEAVRLERERIGLPKSYGGSTFDSWGDQKEGCTVRIHFTDAKEAEQWFNRLTDLLARRDSAREVSCCRQKKFLAIPEQTYS